MKRIINSILKLVIVVTIFALFYTSLEDYNNFLTKEDEASSSIYKKEKEIKKELNKLNKFQKEEKRRGIEIEKMSYTVEEVQRLVTKDIEEIISKELGFFELLKIHVVKDLTFINAYHIEVNIKFIGNSLLSVYDFNEALEKELNQSKNSRYIGKEIDKDEVKIRLVLIKGLS